MLESQTPDAEIMLRFDKRHVVNDSIFAAFNTVLRILLGQWGKKTVSIPPPRRILLANAGHLGDIIISTALLPVLHKAFPGVEIGYLTGSYGHPVVDGHPLIKHVHYADHWYSRRDLQPLWRKVFDYWRFIPRIVREIRAIGYDTTIDVRTWFANYIPLLWWTRIPVRIGCDRVGWGSLLTHNVPRAGTRQHEMRHHLAMLGPLQLTPDQISVARPVLSPPSKEDRLKAEAVLSGANRYRVLHPCANAAVKDWPLENWVVLARRLLQKGITPVVTGAGERDDAVAATLAQDAPGCINAVNRLSWSELMAMLLGAEVVYSVDTSVGHAAAALDVPTVAICGGFTDPVLFAPHGATVVTHELPCHPCFNKHGCHDPQCILGISVEDVEAAYVAETAIATNRRNAL